MLEYRFRGYDYSCSRDEAYKAALLAAAHGNDVTGFGNALERQPDHYLEKSSLWQAILYTFGTMAKKYTLHEAFSIYQQAKIQPLERIELDYPYCPTE